MSEYIQVTAITTEFQWPTRDCDGDPADSRATVAPTGGAGLSTAVKTTIKGIQVCGGPSHSQCIVSIYGHDGTTLLRSINTPTVSATNMGNNKNRIEFTVPGGFSVTTDAAASPVNVFIEYDPVLPK